jgi:hypothetical protein
VSLASQDQDRKKALRPSWRKKIAYLKWLPTYGWQRLSRQSARGPVHLMIAVADHFEPAIVPGDGRARMPLAEQEARIERWTGEYPKLVDAWRDHDGRPFVHTYFYPAEQYLSGLLARLAGHCHAGYGEIEVHLHHGAQAPDTVENTRRVLSEFRDRLAYEHGCLSRMDGENLPRYAFVHGNFALANSYGGRACGVDSEMQVLADTGCYADMTLPTGVFHPSQIAKINALYECAEPLERRAAHRAGKDLRREQPPRIFPLMVQGPLVLHRSAKGWKIDTGALTAPYPPSLPRLQSWKKAAIRVQGRPDWIFIKLHCHGMDPTQESALLGDPMRRFLQELVNGAEERNEILHFVTAREMVNIILAACDGREGDPGQYRDYRLKSMRSKSREVTSGNYSQAVLRG